MSATERLRNRPRLWVSAGLITAGLAGGAILGTTFSANAATTTGSSATTAAGTGSAGTGSAGTGSAGTGSGSATPSIPSMPAHGSAAHEDAETPVTGATATKAQAAAVKYVGSGTAGAVTTDFTKHGYEVTVTKSDGTQVEVHLDSNLTVMQGGPGRFGGPGGNQPPSGAGDPGGNQPPSSSASVG